MMSLQLFPHTNPGEGTKEEIDPKSGVEDEVFSPQEKVSDQGKKCENKLLQLPNTTAPTEEKAGGSTEGLVGQRERGDEATLPGSTEANNLQGSDLGQKEQQTTHEANNPVSEVIKQLVELEAQTEQSTTQAEPKVLESQCLEILASKEMMENSIEQDDNSVVFAAFDKFNTPAVASTTEPELEISFVSESHLSKQLGDHKCDEKQKSQSPSVSEGLPSDIKFGSFSDESSGGEEAVEVKPVPTKEQGSTHNVESVTNTECVATPLSTKSVTTSRDVEDVSVQPVGSSRNTDKSQSSPSMNKVSNLSGVTSSDSPSCPKSVSSEENLQVQNVSSPLTTAATNYSFQISKFVFQVRVFSQV